MTRVLQRHVTSWAKCLVTSSVKSHAHNWKGRELSNLASTLGGRTYPSASGSEKVVFAPVSYTLESPTKQWDLGLPRAMNHWMKIPEEKLKTIYEISELVCAAYNVFDDVQDSTALRRGEPAAHLVFGTTLSMNSSVFVFFLALEKCLTLNHPQAARVFTEEMQKMQVGQGIDGYWRDTLYCPTEKEYMDMVKTKTGAFYTLPVRLMQLCSKNTSDLRPLLECLGPYFQIRDDYANLRTKEVEEEKGFCDDITEGKFSFMMVHGIRSNPKDKQLLNILKQRTQDREVKKRCLQLLEKAGSFEYTRNVLCTIEAQIRSEIAALGGNPDMSALVDKLKKFYREQ